MHTLVPWAAYLGVTVHCEGVREIPEPRAECEMLGSTLGLPISAGRSNLEAIAHCCGE